MSAVLVITVSILLLAALVLLVISVVAEQLNRYRQRQRISRQTAWALMRLRRLQHDAERQLHDIVQTEQERGGGVP